MHLKQGPQVWKHGPKGAAGGCRQHLPPAAPQVAARAAEADPVGRSTRRRRPARRRLRVTLWAQPSGGSCGRSRRPSAAPSLTMFAASTPTASSSLVNSQHTRKHTQFSLLPSLPQREGLAPNLNSLKQPRALQPTLSHAYTLYTHETRVSRPRRGGSS